MARYIGHFSHWYEWGCMLYARFIVDPEPRPDDPHEAAQLYNRIWYACIPHGTRPRGGSERAPRRRPEARLPDAGAVRPGVPCHPGG